MIRLYETNEPAAQANIDKVIGTPSKSVQGNQGSGKKPNDLYQSILKNIDKYNYLCEDAFAGPITRKEILDHLGEIKPGRNSDAHSRCSQGRKTAPKAPLTVPKGPKFNTDKRNSLKDKSGYQTTEELELEEIKKMRVVVESQKKMNQSSLKSLESYTKPALPKKEATNFTEFNLSTNDRSSKHSEFRKHNMEKLEEQRELGKHQQEQKKKEEQLKCEQMLSYYNQSRGIKTEMKEGDEKVFVSLRSQLDNALTRKEEPIVFTISSPAIKSKHRPLTTPKSPTLSVKKRCEFADKAKYLKSSEEMELEIISQNEFKARPMPKNSMSGLKSGVEHTPSAKKTTFREFNLSQTKKKTILTTEELELRTFNKEFKAT